MTKLEELSSKYSWKDLNSMPGDGELRQNLFSPFLTDLHENKIIYYERFLCVAILKDIIITPEKFEATAIPHINIEKTEGEHSRFTKKHWTFGAAWPYIRLLGDHFGTYGMWLIWTDKELVKTVEELARKKDFETALNLTLYKEHDKTK